MTKRLFLIDGNFFCYRAYYAIRRLATSYGQPTNAIYGFVAMLNKLIRDENPDYLAVSFDLKGPTFRHKKFKEYKIHRRPMPDELVSQFPLIKEIITVYRIPIFEQKGFEADDVLATLARKAVLQKLDVYVVTGDKDILQIVDKHIKVYASHKEGLICDEGWVKERYGIKPKMIIEMMALMGDASDNIPGVPGIGEKTASKLIERFGSLDNVFANIDKITPVVRERIKKFKKQAQLSRELAEIDLNVPLKVEWESLKLSDPDYQNLLKLFTKLEFGNLVKQLQAKSAMVQERETVHKIISKETTAGTSENVNALKCASTSKYTSISKHTSTSEHTLKGTSTLKGANALKGASTFLQKLTKTKEFAFDVDTTDSNPMLARVIGLSFCIKQGEACYIKMTDTLALKKLKMVFEDAKIKKITHNAKYKKIVFRNLGFELNGVSFDTMVAAYLLNSSRSNYSLDQLALEYLKFSPHLYSDGEHSLRCSQRADLSFSLKGILEDRLKAGKLFQLNQRMELPLIDVLADMEINGVKIDVKLLKDMSKEIEGDLARLTDQIYETAGMEFNINSPKQLSFVLFEKLKLPVFKKTKTGASTDTGVLERLTTLHALPASLLRYRHLSKIKSTYVDSLPRLVNPNTGRVHTSFNQTVTATGRLSSSSPNLQNVPIKGELGRRIRKAFVPAGANNIFLAADYSQIELRILAHLSGDEGLISAFLNERDVHTQTASLVFNVKEKDVSAAMRENAKTVNFGIIYGMGPYALAKDLGINPLDAKKFIEAYFKRYPKVKIYINKQIEQAKKRGFVTTLLERRRYIPEINSSDIHLKQFAGRAAVNAPIQGTASDLIKLAMIDIYSALRKNCLKALMLLQLHDELIFEVPESEFRKLSQIVKNIMEGVLKLNVPIKVTIKKGNNWLEMVEIN